MLVRDIDKRLDMRLILKLKQDTELFKVTADVDLTLPVYIFGKENTTWMSTYLPKLDRNSKIELINRKFKSVEMENAYVVDSRINNVKDLAIIDKLMDIPSFIVNRSDMSNGFLNIYARFHSSRIAEVSALLSEYTADSENSRVDWLGPSMGIISITDLIHSTYPLSIVSYRTPFTEDDKVLSDLMGEGGVMAEVRNSFNREGKISAVLYLDHNIDGKYDEVQTISAEDGVYQLDTHNVFHNIVRDEANKLHIMRTRYFIKPQGEDAEITVFMPSGSVYEYYSMLYGIARKHKNDIVVTGLRPYTPSIWEYL